MRTNLEIKNPYLRTLMADELNGVRKFCHKQRMEEGIRYWMIFEIHNCFGRMDQHLNKFGLGVLTGESGGAFKSTQKAVYLKSLAADYLSTIDAPRSGQVHFHDLDHYASERSVLHEQLLQALNLTREDDFDMESWARELVSIDTKEQA